MEYKTLQKQGYAEIEEKRSRFLAFAAPFSTEADVLQFLKQKKEAYPDARHHVYAYRLRHDHTSRFSDDGEPAKTAGVPVLDVLTKEDIFDCIIVVVRYFGGTLLGTGGLVRAYGKSAKAAMEDAGIVTMRPSITYEGHINYADWGKFQNITEANGAKIIDSQFGSAISVQVLIQQTDAPRLLSALTEQFCGKTILEKQEEFFTAW